MSAIISRIAAIHNPTTKAQATKLIRAARHDGLSLPAGRQRELAATLADLAAAQRERRASRRQSQASATAAPIQERLAIYRRRKAQLIRATVASAFASANYRQSGSRWAGGEHETCILIYSSTTKRWTSWNGEPCTGCAGESFRAWSRNGKWSGSNSRHTIQVRPDWVSRVEGHDLAVVDGMFTLDAEPIQGHGPELFRAEWVEQGRGFELNAVSGYIARIGDTTYHAKTARAALDGVQRKAGLKPQRRKGTIDLDRLARRHGDLPVTIADSFAVGNCKSGTYSWCHAVGIDPCGVATVADLITGYKLRPLPEVVSVLRRVVRDRHNRQPIESSVPSALELEGRVIFDSEGGFRIEPSNN